MKRYRVRRLVLLLVLLISLAMPFSNGTFESPLPADAPTSEAAKSTAAILESLPVKGRAPKTGYAREQFGDGWSSILGCDMRNRVLQRDLINIRIDNECKVTSGTLQDPYTGKTIEFIRGDTTSDDVQIDHVVALSNAWQTGAQQLTYVQRVAFANDARNLLAVEGAANQQKGDGDAATWLPDNKSFRCQYVTRQVKVKAKYHLWVTPAERDAIMRILSNC